jgi:hypothetical protein
MPSPKYGETSTVTEDEPELHHHHHDQVSPNHQGRDQEEDNQKGVHEVSVQDSNTQTDLAGTFKHWSSVDLDYVLSHNPDFVMKHLRSDNYKISDSKRSPRQALEANQREEEEPQASPGGQLSKERGRGAPGKPWRPTDKTERKRSPRQALEANQQEEEEPQASPGGQLTTERGRGAPGKPWRPTDKRERKRSPRQALEADRQKREKPASTSRHSPVIFKPKADYI